MDFLPAKDPREGEEFLRADAPRAENFLPTNGDACLSAIFRMLYLQKIQGMAYCLVYVNEQHVEGTRAMINLLVDSYIS